MNEELQTNEQPISPFNGTNYRDTALKVDENVARISQNLRSKSNLFFFGFGCSLFFLFIAFMSITSTPNLVELWGKGLAVYMFLLALFILLLIFLYRVASKVHYFDLTQRRYYCGKRADDKSIHLSNIVGIQVIRKSIYNNSQKYYSFELNIVTKSGKRIKISDHAEGEWIKIEAKQLADFLKVELNLINTSA